MKGNNRPKGNKTDHLDMILLWILIILHTVILFWIADFSKKAISYPDEMVFYDIAKSLFSGRPIALHEVSYSYTNLAYPLILAPLMGIADTVLRIRMISLLNAVLMTLPALAVWMIGGELKLRRGLRWASVIVMLVWPDLVTAGTFMSENLYWPLASFGMLFILRSLIRKKPLWAVLAGIFSYLCYFCKEVGICFPLAYAAMQLADPLFESFRLERADREERGWLSACLRNVDWKSLGIFLVSFVIPYLAVNRLLLSSVTNGYLAAVQTEAFSDLYHLLYFVRDLLTYFVAVSLSFFILPVIAPLMHYRKLAAETRKAWLFGMILLLGTIVTVCYTIGMLEDLGQYRVRLHLRYFAPVIALLLPAYFASRKDMEILNEAEKRKLRTRIAVSGVCFLLAMLWLLKSPLPGAVNETLGLGYLRNMEEQGGMLALNRADIPDSITFDTGALLTCAVCALLLSGGTMLSRGEKTRRAVSGCFALVCTAVCVLNSALGVGRLRTHYTLLEALRDDMAAVNAYLAAEDADSNVLFLCDTWFDEDAKAYDLYLDAGREYVTDRNSLRQVIGNSRDRRISLTDTQMLESIFHLPFTAEHMDYVIERTDAEPVTALLSDLTPVDVTMPNGMLRLYRNEETADLMKVPDADEGRLLSEIIFARDGYNADQYVARGISGCEGYFSWTNGQELEVRIPEVFMDEPKTVRIDTYVTYHGPQQVVAYQNGEEIARGVMNGDDLFSFALRPSEGECIFTLTFPDALTPASIGENDDTRMIALALRSIRILEGTD